MTEFQSKFDPRSGPQRHKMLATIIALATEIQRGVAFSSKGNIMTHLKAIGWLPKTVRHKKVALAMLAEQARQGWGYRPKGNVEKILEKK